MSRIAFKPQRHWTVLVYQGNGCQQKQSVHESDILELQKLPSSDRVTILTQGHSDYQEDILERRNIRQAKAKQKLSEPVDSVVGRQNQPEQLANFIRWGMKNYPSERVCLVVSGFGGGNNGMIVDEEDGLLNLSEIRRGLDAGLDGEELDILAFDGNWMSCIEAAAEFEGTSKLMVASQGRMKSWDYEKSFSGLLANTKVEADELASELVAADGGESGMSVLDLAEVPNVLYWTEVLLRASADYGLDKEVLTSSEWVSHFKDLPSVIEQFNQPDVPGALRELAEEAQGALDDLTIEHNPAPSTKTGGVSVATFYETSEDGREFRRWTSWDEFLRGQVGAIRAS